MPDFSPWGAAAQSGMGAYNYPQPIPQSVSGVAAGGGLPQMNQGMAPPPPAPFSLGPQTGYMGPQSGTPMQSMNGAPGINGGRFNPMGQPTGIGQGGMNPLMGFLLPFLMQRMGLGGAQGGAPRGPSPIPSMNGQLGSVGAPQMNPGGNMPQGNAFGLGGGQPPQRILQGGPPASSLQTKSPFDMASLNTMGGPVGGMPPGMGAPPPPTGIPMSLQTQANNAFNPQPQAPPPQRIMEGTTGPGKTPPAPPASPPMSPEMQMQQQAQQAQLNNSLSQIAMNNPTMAALLRQQLMGQLGY